MGRLSGCHAAAYAQAWVAAHQDKPRGGRLWAGCRGAGHFLGGLDDANAEAFVARVKSYIQNDAPRTRQDA